MSYSNEEPYIELQLPYQTKIFPLEKSIGDLQLSINDTTNTIKGKCLAKSIQSEEYMPTSCSNKNRTRVISDVPIVLKEKGFKRILDVYKTFVERNTFPLKTETGYDNNLHFFNQENDFILTIEKEMEIINCNDKVWYLDLPLPNGTDKIKPSQFLPAAFPLQMPVSSKIIWPIYVWSDYLFSALWFTLYEPYFNDNAQNNCYIGDCCRISSSAILIPPYRIGNNVTIEAGAIVSGSQIGDYSRIGQGSIIRNSIIMQGVSLPLGVNVLMSIVESGCLINSSVQFSVIAENVFLGGGVHVTDVILNIDQKSYLEKKTVFTSNGIDKVDSGSVVLGCAIGPNSCIGANVLLKPGETIISGSRRLPHKGE